MTSDALQRKIGRKPLPYAQGYEFFEAIGPVGDLKRQVEEALRRLAGLDTSRIKVEAEGGTVILKSIVHDWSERDRAERAAWAAPGVRRRVEDLLAVDPEPVPWPPSFRGAAGEPGTV